METKICKCCGRELQITAFKYTRWGHYAEVCNECVTKKTAENKAARMEAQRIKDAQSEKEMRSLRLCDFTPRELIEELKRRGYEGRLTYVETHTIDLSTF